MLVLLSASQFRYTSNQDAAATFECTRSKHQSPWRTARALFLVHKIDNVNTNHQTATLIASVRGCTREPRFDIGADLTCVPHRHTPCTLHICDNVHTGMLKLELRTPVRRMYDAGSPIIPKTNGLHLNDNAVNKYACVACERVNGVQAKCMVADRHETFDVYSPLVAEQQQLTEQRSCCACKCSANRLCIHVKGCLTSSKGTKVQIVSGFVKTEQDTMRVVQQHVNMLHDGVLTIFMWHISRMSLSLGTGRKCTDQHMHALA